MDEYEDLSLDEDSSDDDDQNKGSSKRMTSSNEANSCKNTRNVNSINGCTKKHQEVEPYSGNTEGTTSSSSHLREGSAIRKRAQNIVRSRQSYINYLTTCAMRLHFQTTMSHAEPHPMCIVSGHILNFIISKFRDAGRLSLPIDGSTAKHFIPFIKMFFDSDQSKRLSNEKEISFQLPELKISEAHYIEDGQANVFGLIKEILILEKEFNIFPQTNLSLTGEMQDDLLKCGSTSDGCSTAKWLSPEHFCEKELDFMYEVAEMPEYNAKYIQEDTVNPIYVRLQNTDSVIDSLTMSDEEITSNLKQASRDNSSEYIDAGLFRSEIIKILQTAMPHDGLARTCFPEDPVVEEISSFSNKVKWSIEGKYLSHTICIDRVVAVKLDFYPHFMLQFFERLSNRFSPKEMEELKSENLFIIPKSAEENHNEIWRYSCSSLENRILSLFTLEQTVCFYLAKAMFYKYIKPLTEEDISGKKHSFFTSYFMKTTMLWMTEKYSGNDEIWLAENLFSTLKMILAQFMEYMKERKLPHYFYPEANLFQDIPHHFLDAAVKKIELIIGQIQFYIPFNLGVVKELLSDSDFIYSCQSKFFKMIFLKTWI